jgi:hypothetical protein
MRNLIAIALALGLQTAAYAEEAWQVVKPEGLGFSVEFPAKPTIKEEDVDLGDGKSAKVDTFQILAANAIFDVTIAAYPKGTIQSIGEEHVLDNARDGAVANAPGPLLSETKLEFAGRPAREIAVDMTMGMVSRSRLFVIGDRLFIVGAIASKDKTTAEPIE